MEPSRPIGSGLAFSLIVFGIFVDLVQFVLGLILIGEVLDSVIDLAASAVVSLMLYNHDPSLLRRRRLSIVLTGLAEFIPFFNLLPWWTIDMAYIVWSDRRYHRSLRPSDQQKTDSGAASWRL